MTAKTTLKLDKKQKAFALLNDEAITRALHALQRFERRANGTERPSGKFDRAKRWYPTDEEDCGVTMSTRTPSRDWPFSYLKACKTLRHCIALEDADADAVRIVKTYIKAQTSEERLSSFTQEQLLAQRLSLVLPVSKPTEQTAKRL